ncbi:MAG: HAD family hydrolase [Candidatus Saccharimonadales bacterium]
MAETKKDGQPFAVFDIDGTVIRWQLYHAIFGALARAGHVTPESFNQVRAARMVWKKRASENSFKEYEQTLIKAHDAAITKIAYADYLAAVQTVFDQYKDQTYTYTRDLIGTLKARGYLLFAISASQIEIVKLLADYYDFDDCGGSVYEVKAGQFTGHNQILKHNRKPEYLQQLIKKHDAATAQSIALGDSMSDIPMLEIAEQPIAFNPDKTLFDHARSRGWQIVIERKNVVYELQSKDGSYVLA